MSGIESINNALVFEGANGEPFTTSLVIAAETGNQHKNVLALIRKHLADLNEVGRVAFQTRPFETAGGTQRREVAELDEPAAALLITNLGGSTVVWDFRKRLVAGFYAMRQALARRDIQPLQGHDLMAAGYVEAMKQLEARDVRIHQLEAKVTADAPKVAYIDQYVTDADCLLFSTVASTNNVKESWLRDLLIAKGWIYAQTDTRWSNKENRKVERNRYSEKADKKRYFRRIPEHKAPRFRGSEVMHTLKITPAGAEAIGRLIGREVAA